MHDIVTAREALELDQKIRLAPKGPRRTLPATSVTRQQNHETATFNRNLSFYASNQVA
jgi:hypothetical protein